MLVVISHTISLRLSFGLRRFLLHLDICTFVLTGIHSVENNVVIVAASIPAIRPLFGRRKALNSSNSAYGAYGRSPYGPKSQGYLRSQRSEFDTRGTDNELTYIGTGKDVLSQGPERYTGEGIRKNTSIIVATRGINPSEHSSEGHGGGADSDKESQVGLANAV